MKKIFILVLSATMMASCTTNTGTGAVGGAMIGSVLGSAIGGISGGWRGSNIGTVVGMAGGAAAGAAIGAAADKAERERYEEYVNEREAYREARYSQASYNQPNYSNDAAYYNANGTGDDRIDFGPSPASASATSTASASTAVASTAAAPQAQSNPTTGSTNGSVPSVPLSRIEAAEAQHSSAFPITIQNARFINDMGDMHIGRGEVVQIVFEVRNTTSNTVYSIVPTVQETTGNKRLFISPSTTIESLAPHSAIRYTAYVSAQTNLKTGTAHFSVKVLSANQLISNVVEFDVALN